jgi:preprotein translocase subunit SecB
VCIFATVYTVAAQSSATSSKHFDCSNIHQLVLDLGSNVQVKEIKGTRVIIEHTITVQHPTKSSQILSAVQSTGVFEVKGWADVTTNQLILKERVVTKELIADKTAATIVHSYVIYKPSNLL